MTLNEVYHLMRGPQREQLAAAAGVSLPTLQVWAKHWVNPRTQKKRKPTMDQIRLLAKADARLTVRDMREEYYPKGGAAESSNAG
jgi:hypothetical protein